MPGASQQHGWRHVRVGQNKLGTATPRACAGRTGWLGSTRREHNRSETCARRQDGTEENRPRVNKEKSRASERRVGSQARGGCARVRNNQFWSVRKAICHLRAVLQIVPTSVISKIAKVTEFLNIYKPLNLKFLPQYLMHWVAYHKLKITKGAQELQIWIKP